ncbi:MAG: hypothetical protein H6R21_2453 [Proteobacteria bacterium]|nr:hypothetical protein [Pseudomonadota bacterium]
MTPRPDMEHDPQLAAIYRAGTAAEPPARLDDTIRAAARRAVAAGPRRSGVRRWMVPVSLAAVIVLSVTVVTMMREQGADRLDSTTLSPETAPPAPVAVQPGDARPPVVTAPKVPEASTARRSPAAPPGLVAPAEPAAPAPAPALQADSLPRRVTAEPGMAAPDSESPAKDKAAEMTRSEGFADTSRDNAAVRSPRRSAPAPMVDAASGAGASAKSAAPAGNALWQDLVLAPPEKWLQRIAELRHAGKTADAAALVAEFRRRFPGEELPQDLR